MRNSVVGKNKQTNKQTNKQKQKRHFSTKGPSFRSVDSDWKGLRGLYLVPNFERSTSRLYIVNLLI